MVDVSVVVPTHDRRELLRQTLRSVRRQRGVDIEIIVVDDGSTDATGDMITALGDTRIRYLHHDRPRGVATARNAGIAAASGRWIALLDDDDLWAPVKLARQLAAADAAGRPWVYAGAVEIDSAGRLLGGLPPDPPDRLVAHLRRRNLMPAGSSNVVVAADLLTEVGGFDVQLRHIADWDCWLRLARRAIPAYDPAPLVAYRMHPRQATLDTTGMTREARVLERRHGIDPAVVHRWEAWSHLREGRRWPAALSYAEAVRGGDVASLGRAAIALLHPRPATTRRPTLQRAPAEDWAAAAGDWLRELTTEAAGGRHHAAGSPPFPTSGASAGNRRRFRRWNGRSMRP